MTSVADNKVKKSGNSEALNDQYQYLPVGGGFVVAKGGEKKLLSHQSSLIVSLLKWTNNVEVNKTVFSHFKGCLMKFYERK